MSSAQQNEGEGRYMYADGRQQQYLLHKQQNQQHHITSDLTSPALNQQRTRVNQQAYPSISLLPTTLQPYHPLRRQNSPEMVFFIPVLLVIAGVAIYKEHKDHKREKRALKAEAAGHTLRSGGIVGAKGHDVVYYNEPAIGMKLHESSQKDTPPVYQQLDTSPLRVPSYAVMAS